MMSKIQHDHTNKTFKNIGHPKEKRMANFLNSLGPSKSGSQWKSTFYYMKNRIRKKVHLMKQGGSSVSENLTEVDLKIYEMSSSGGFDVQYGFDDPMNATNNELLPIDFVNSTVEFDDQMNDNSDEMSQTGFIESMEENVYSKRIVVVGTEEELEGKKGDAMIEEVDCTEEPTVNDTIHRSSSEHFQMNSPASTHCPSPTYDEEDGVLQDIVREIWDEQDDVVNEAVETLSDNERDVSVPCASTYQNNDKSRIVSSGMRGRAVKNVATASSNRFECNRGTLSVPNRNTISSSDRCSVRDIDVRYADTYMNHSLPPSFPPSSIHFPLTARTNNRRAGEKLDKAPQKKTSISLPPNKLDSAKTNVRIPEIQKERLVQLVQNNFLKAVGRFAGSNGASIKANLWQNIAKELNTLGPPRTAVQWKTTFNTIKSCAKAKLADVHNNSDGVVTKPLTRLEEKIVSIYGMDNMDGNQMLGESGFQYEKSIPVTRRFESQTLDLPVTRRFESQTLDLPGHSADYTTNEAYEDSVLQEIIRDIRNEPDHGNAMRTVHAGTTRCTSVSVLTSNAPTKTIYTKKRAPEKSTLSATQRLNSAPQRRTFAPPRSSRPRQSSEIEYISNINQLIDDNGDDDDRRSDQGEPPNNNGRQEKRDRSNLRHQHTSYEMVKQSMDAQERFIEDSNKNHSEMAFLTDRNHLEVLGMFTSTLRAFTDVAREIVNKW